MYGPTCGLIGWHMSQANYLWCGWDPKGWLVLKNIFMLRFCTGGHTSMFCGMVSCIGHMLLTVMCFFELLGGTTLSCLAYVFVPSISSPIASRTKFLGLLAAIDFCTRGKYLSIVVCMDCVHYQLLCSFESTLDQLWQRKPAAHHPQAYLGWWRPGGEHQLLY